MNEFVIPADFIHLYFGREELEDAGAISLARALETDATLKYLHIGHNRIGDVGAIALARMLETNRTLLVFQFSENLFGDAGAIAFARALEINRTLKTLELFDNEIGDAGAIALARALEVNRTLTHIGLSKNRFGDTGAIALMRVVSTGTTPITLHLMPPKCEFAQRRVLKALADAHMSQEEETLTGLDLLRRRHGTHLADLMNWRHAAKTMTRKLPDVVVDRVGEMLYPTA